MHGHENCESGRPLEVLRGYRRPPDLHCADIGVVIGACRGGGIGGEATTGPYPSYGNATDPDL